MATLQEAIDSLNAAAFAYHGKIDEINQAKNNFLSSSQDVFIVQHSLASLSGGAVVAGENIRVFNTVVKPLSGVELSDGQFDLIAGKYFIEGFFKLYRVGYHSLIMRNVTDNKDHVLSSGYISSSVLVSQTECIQFYLDIDSNKTISFIHDVELAKSTNGLGEGGVTGQNVFASLTIKRVG